MALPPLNGGAAASSRTESPDRSPRPGGASTSTPQPRTAASNLASSLAPLLPPSPSHAPSPFRTGMGAPSGASTPGPVRSRTFDVGSLSQPQSPSRSSRRVFSAANAKPRIDCGPRKLTQAQQAAQLHTQLMEILRTEWKNIKTTNLGVLSGTAVVEELLLRRIQTAARELHLLAITHAPAAERLAELCRGMSVAELQQLQVMFDSTGHPELSDYVRLMVYNTSDPAAKEVVGDLRALRAGSGTRRARSTPSRRRGPPQPPPRRPDPFASDPRSLRFAHLLTSDHPLVAGAHAAAERRRAEEEEARRLAEAKAARARARAEAAALGSVAGEDSFATGEQERRMADASARSALLQQHRRGDPPEILPYYLADVQEQWRRTVGTRVSAEGVFGTSIMLSEPLPPYEAPPEVARMRADAEAAAANPPPSRGGTGGLNSPALNSPRPSASTPAGGRPGPAPWGGAGGLPFSRLRTGGGPSPGSNGGAGPSGGSGSQSQSQMLQVVQAAAERSGSAGGGGGGGAGREGSAGGAGGGGGRDAPPSSGGGAEGPGVSRFAPAAAGSQGTGTSSGAGTGTGTGSGSAGEGPAGRLHRPPGLSVSVPQGPEDEAGGGHGGTE
ncbi:hypothetical protein HYH03_002850 [Edaphochlamys debaryana]|uniref:Uncharacterized protein n=1 Tax=Edaphochlamys debaryana TaxID=47281 RepID=A0A836C509_9CHLO|nr:hypothetical protein HYH03_002850 [Edaphochlamys debaryana]|eukprot:KAG2499272.1 hypothetical protein HYH03_002850 [Edaphochlamys debaryana]